VTQDDEASATVQLDDRSVPARIVLTGSVGSYYSDDLFSTCLQAIERGVPVELVLGEVTHLGAAAAQIVLAMRAALARRGLGFELRDVPGKLAPLLAMAGLTSTGAVS